MIYDIIMNMKKIKISPVWIPINIFFIIMFFFIIKSTLLVEQNDFSVYFLNVGQGDSIFIETPSNYQILVDGGRNEKVLNELGKIIPSHDNKIDLVIATHPDADHIGGLIHVLNSFEVKKILKTYKTKSTKTSATFEKLVIEEGAEVIYVEKPMRYELSDKTKIDILWPQTKILETGDDNETSIIVRISNGEGEVLLTGDAGKRTESILLKTVPELLQSDILKAGHHGSKFSSLETFFEKVNPSSIIFSAGENNSYGHPSPTIVELAEKFAKTYYTKNGTIKFKGKNGSELIYYQ